MILLNSKTMDYVIDGVTFTLKQMGSVTKAALLDEIRSKEIGNIHASFLFMQKMIVGVKGLTNEDGKDIPMHIEDGSDYIATDMLECLPEEVLSELSYETAKFGGLIKEEEKK